MGLHYEQYGDKTRPLLLFLHGGGVSSWMWHQQLHYFTDYYCVTVDLPEHGLQASTEKFSIKHSAYMIGELIEKLANEKSVTVIGFSLGAQVLVQLLSDRPNVIDFAMINSALVTPTPYMNKLIRPVIALTYPLIKNRTFSKLQATTLFIGEDYFEKYYNESCQMKQQTLVRIMKENLSFALPETFSEAKVKILVTVGEKERKMMKKSATTLTNHHQQCTAILIDGVGHGAPLENPNLFNRILERWLKEVT